MSDVQRDSLRKRLFSSIGSKGCTNSDCIINDNSKGLHTNSSCKCLGKLSRFQIQILFNNIAREITKDECE